MNRNKECVIIKTYYGHNQIEKKDQLDTRKEIMSENQALFLALHWKLIDFIIEFNQEGSCLKIGHVAIL